MKKLELKFNDLQEYKHNKDHVLNFIKDVAPTKEVFFLYLVINEAVNNALLHSETNNQIKLRVDVSLHSRFFVRVRETGKGFHGNQKISNMRASKKDLFKDRLYAEGGRGLLLMDEICDYISFNRTGTEILLVKKILN